MLNADPKCKGLIPRYRVTKNETEVAILDYVLVCQELHQYLEDMMIYEERKFTLTKFYLTSKGMVKKLESDHKFSII